MFRDRTEDEFRLVLGKGRVNRIFGIGHICILQASRRSAVDLACGELDQPLTAPDTGLGNPQVLGKIQSENFERDALLGRMTERLAGCHYLYAVGRPLPNQILPNNR